MKNDNRLKVPALISLQRSLTFDTYLHQVATLSPPA